MAGLAMRATAWRWRGLGVGGRLGPLGDGPFRRRFGWLLQQKGIPQVAGMVAAGGMPQAIIAHLVEAGWQDVLEKAPDELVAGHGLVAMAIGRPVLVTEGGGLGVDGQDAVVGDGDAESVACSASTSMSGTLSQVGRFWLLRRLALGFEVLLEGVAESVGGGCRCGVSLEGGAIGGGATAVAVGVHLEDGRMMDEPVDGGDGDGLVGEDSVPGAEGLVGGDGEAAGLKAPGDEFEEDGCLGLVLSGVTDVVEDDQVEA